MTRVVYRIVAHDDGWAYQVGDTFSETFASQGSAREAALVAAREQRVPGENVGIMFENADGTWHEEVADGHDRPIASVEG
jgi:hypothetical protein